MLGLQLGEEINGYLAVIKGESAVYITAVPMTAVVFPVFFLLVFFAVSGILIFPYIVICGVLGFTDHANNLPTRIMGAVLGALQGFLIAAVVLVPVDGMVDVAQEAVTYVEENHPDFKNTNQITSLYYGNIDTLYENPLLDIVDDNFGFIYDQMTTIEVHGETVHVVKAVDDLLELYVYYGELGGEEGFDYKNMTAHDKSVIDEMINRFGDDQLMTVIVSNAFQSIGDATQSGAFKLEIDEPLKSLMTDLLKTFSTSNEDTIEGDLHTFSEVYYLMSREGVFNAGDINQMFTVFLTLDENGDSAFKRLCGILDLNPRYEHMSDRLSNMAMDMLLQNSGVEQDVVETIENVKTTVNDVLSIEKESFETPEEYKAAVNEEVSTTLTDNGIALDDEQLDQLTDYIIKEKEENGKTEFTDADMADFLAKYYDIYAGTGKLPELPEDVVIPGDVVIP